MTSLFLYPRSKMVAPRKVLGPTSRLKAKKKSNAVHPEGAGNESVAAFVRTARGKLQQAAEEARLAAETEAPLLRQQADQAVAPSQAPLRRGLLHRAAELEARSAAADAACLKLVRELRPFERALEPLRPIETPLRNGMPQDARSVFAFVGTQGRSHFSQAVLERCKARCNGQALSTDIIEPDMCKPCGVQMFQVPNDAVLVCRQCHASRPYISTTNARGGYSGMPEVRTYSYLHSGHFHEVLLFLQGIESTVVPQAVVDGVVAILCQKRIPDAQVSYRHIHDALKDDKHSTYYRHYVQIYHRIFPDRPRPILTVEQETRLHACFFASQPVFERHKGNRTNYLSYPYVVSRFCQLLGYTFLQRVIILLKGGNNLGEQDTVWGAMCADPALNWEYIPLPEQDGASGSLLNYCAGWARPAP